MAIAAHPEIQQYASANRSAAADESSRRMAALVTRLLTESCANETKAVVKGSLSGISIMSASDAPDGLRPRVILTVRRAQARGAAMRGSPK